MATGMATRQKREPTSRIGHERSGAILTAVPAPRAMAVPVAERVDGCILALARLAVAVRRGTASDPANVVRDVATLLERHQAERAKPAHHGWTDAVVKAVAEVYRHVQAEARRQPQTRRKAPPFTLPADEYASRLRAALAPFGIKPEEGELRGLALSSEQIHEAGKSGAIEAAQKALFPCLDKMLARRLGGHPVTGQPSDEARALRPLLERGATSARTLQERQKKHRRAEIEPVVTDSDARKYLADLALDDVERARREALRR